MTPEQFYKLVMNHPDLRREYSEFEPEPKFMDEGPIYELKEIDGVYQYNGG